MFRITVKTISGRVLAESSWKTRSLCLEWYRGLVFGLEPNCNSMDFFPFSIVEEKGGLNGYS